MIRITKDDIRRTVIRIARDDLIRHPVEQPEPEAPPPAPEAE